MIDIIIILSSAQNVKEKYEIETGKPIFLQKQ